MYTPQAVAGVFESQSQAEQAVQALRQAGFTEDEIGYAARGADATPDTTEAVNVNVDDEAHRGGTREGLVMGAITGVSFGSIVGVAAALLIPGIGPVIAGGILGAALTGAVAGAATGGIAGALSEWGFSETEVAHYQGEFEAGRTLVTVRTLDPTRQQQASEILTRFGATSAG